MNTQRTWARLQALMLLVVLLSPCSLFGQRAKALPTSKIDTAVRLEMKQQNLVGVSIGVIWGGEISYLQGYGFADVKRRIPVTPSTIYNWASNSKPFLAVRAMQLVQKGVLDLDSPIHNYVQGLPAALQPVTARQLLCHQSGIPHYRNGRVVPSPDLPSDPLQQLDPRIAVGRFELSPLIFEPGSRTEYSSHAYVLLSAVVQGAGREELAAQLDREIVRPLKLTSFQLDLPFDKQPGNWTTSYTRVGGAFRVVPDVAHFWKHGAGGYKSDVKDFTRFAQALMNRELLSSDTTERMWTRQQHSDGSQADYGLGVRVSGTGSGLKVWHSGSQTETRTRMVLYPIRRHGIVVMSNTYQADPAKISTAIYRAIEQGN